MTHSKNGNNWKNLFKQPKENLNQKSIRTIDPIRDKSNWNSYDAGGTPSKVERLTYFLGLTLNQILVIVQPICWKKSVICSPNAEKSMDAFMKLFLFRGWTSIDCSWKNTNLKLSIGKPKQTGLQTRTAHQTTAANLLPNFNTKTSTSSHTNGKPNPHGWLYVLSSMHAIYTFYI